MESSAQMTDPSLTQATLPTSDPSALGSAPKNQRARRMPGRERRSMILTSAAGFFAERGFSASTRDLAAVLGVRQALLYKYYPSKEALLAAMFDKVFADQWNLEWLQALDDTSAPLANRLVSVYGRILSGDDIGLRLLLRAVLDGRTDAHVRAGFMFENIVTPLIRELRREAELPDLATKPLLNGEEELANMLHGAMLFHALREHLYHMPVNLVREDTLAFFVTTFLQGARQSLLKLHHGEFGASLRDASLREARANS